MDDNALLQLVQSLSLHEKAVLCSGLDFWHTKPNPEKGIPSLCMTDGPHGVRYEVHDEAEKGAVGGTSRRATCFPPEVTLACSFDPSLTLRVGEAIGEEALTNGVGLVLGPGVNIKRSPLGGRNFEYYSEDPLLAGELAAGFIEGLQRKGVGASLKHYAANNQEEYRMSISAAVDERALFDIYLKAFEIAVHKAKPATVMASYNKVNGVYASENRRLLTDILRLRFGFDGAVVSDWGAVNDRVAGIEAGMDLEMPTSGGANDYAIEQAVQAGTLNEDTLDTACWNLLRLIFRYSKEGQPAPACDYNAHHTLAIEAACQSAVLLKNSGILPLTGNETVAVIGEMAAKPHYQGGGSSLINPMHLVSFLDAMRNEGKPFTYAPGYADTESNDALRKEAAQAAAAADVALLFLGLPDSFECEGGDRPHMHLPQSQMQLLEAVTKANRNVVVLLCCGAPVEAHWLSAVKGLLCLYLGGEGGGEAAVHLLYGKANPAGKLAESWPLALEDTPAFHHFPMGPIEVTYNESIFVGYRYYNTANKNVLFPFGFGLSYTDFFYSNLRLESEHIAVGEEVKLHFTIKNTGSVAGDEIAQIYLSRMSSAFFQPAHELKAFCRVPLQPGEEKEIILSLPYRDLGFYDTGRASEVVEAGRYEIQVGPSSRTLPLSTVFQVEGASVQPFTPVASAVGPYGHIENNLFEADNFAALYGGTLLGNTPPKKGEYTLATPLGLMQDSFAARRMFSIFLFVGNRSIHFSPDATVNKRMVQNMAHQLPLKNMVLFSGGHVSPAACQAFLDLCNGTGGFWRFLRLLLKTPPYLKDK